MTTPGSRASRDRHPRAYLGVGLGVLTVSTAALLIRLAQAGAHSLVVAAWRLTLATAILAPITIGTRRAELRRLSCREWASLTLAGFLLAIHFAAWITSLAYTSVAASVVLVSTSPIFVGLGSHLILRERLSRTMAIALVVASLGAAIIGLADHREDSHRLFGDLLALAGAVTGAGYFLIGRRLRGRLSLLAYVLPVYGISAVVLMTVVLLSPLRPIPTRLETWLWLTLMAVGPQVLGHSSLNWALRYLSATFVTVATLAEPIASTLLAWWILSEQPSLAVVIGGGLTMAGIGLASLAEREAHRRTTLDEPPPHL
jgi:drug/metabolite transporter (DMT)-like permease